MSPTLSADDGVDLVCGRGRSYSGGIELFAGS